ncbi:potassium channel subfamily K member 10 [Brachionus plicatilis]|uniref:Potassium channel subfamily K member 10 n=1 Tax=Brachionus plicatilis TaxID=10195 RepID=A0A3M7R4B4_BRAPC|nr:potassium channel subfamily K member 10 [Brachionus plicatilis]
MKINKILLTLVAIEVGLIVFGGYLYSLIPICSHEISQLHYLSNCSYTTPSLSDSIFFVITTITTIGYGNLTPSTDTGKIFTIMVAFIGIPINIVFLAKIGEILKKGSAYLLKPIKKLSNNKKIFIIIQIIFSVISGTIIFLLVPGFVIMRLENWNYIDALYYIFVTLFTIGFGDLVAGSNFKLSSPVWMNVYRFSLYLWMYLGMAYISLIITLVLDYFKANAENIRKEVINMIEDKINLTIRRYLSARKIQLKSRNKLSREEKLNRKLIKQGLRIKINYQEDKLEEMARRRSKCKTNVNLKAYFENYLQENKAFDQLEDKTPNFDVASLNKIEENEEIDDECLKIDIEKCDYSPNVQPESNIFTNDYYDTVTSDDYLNTLSTIDQSPNQHRHVQFIFSNNETDKNDVFFY